MSKQRVVILGGGFAGVYTAMHLERLLGRREDIEIVLVSRENYLVFQPMLAEVVSGNIGILDTVTPIRRLLKRTTLYVREITSIDLPDQSVTVAPGFGATPTKIQYDHLVIALGNVTDFRKIPGLHDHAFPFKNLGDALRLRDHLIHVLGEAAVADDAALREQLLTFVVSGGGFSGVEVCAEINDFVRRTMKKEFQAEAPEVRVILVHAHERILDREMPEQLGLYAQEQLRGRGVEFIFNCRLRTATPEFAVLDDGRHIATRTLVSTVPSSPNPLILDLDIPTERGRIRTGLTMQVEASSNLWSLGDCALIPNPSGEGICPPTAQFATRQAKTCAHNVLAAIDGGEQKEFRFAELGKMAALGHRRAIARLFGRVNLRGFFAWVFWRTAYWSKLPGMDRKIKVGASWLLDLVCPPELVQTKLDVPSTLSEEYYEPGEIVFHAGDPNDRLLIVTSGKVEVLRGDPDANAVVAELTSGQCFGASGLLEDEPGALSLRCAEPLTVVAYRKQLLAPLLALPDMRAGIERLRDRDLSRDGTRGEST